MINNFKNIFILASAIYTMAIPSLSSAQVMEPKLMDVVVTTAYIPTGFDSNDNIQVMIESYLPDTCYKLGPHSVVKNEEAKKIEIRQQALRYDGVCLMVIVPYYHMVSVGLLKPGHYEVADFAKKKNLGLLPVKAATRSEADDYLYAPVENATVKMHEDGKRYVEISGTFSNSCMHLSQTKVIRESKSVITVLPITDVENEQCRSGEYPFRHEEELPVLEAGRYFLHVRSLNGNAATNLFDVR